MAKCQYMEAAYPILDADECCDPMMHRHESRVFGLATALAKTFAAESPSDEQIGWFFNDADAVVDNFQPAPDQWEVLELPSDDEERDIARRFSINGIEYVLPESEWTPATPVARTTYDSWFEEQEK